MMFLACIHLSAQTIIPVHCPIDSQLIEWENIDVSEYKGTLRDFQKVGYPAYYDKQVEQCPKCGYAGFKMDFGIHYSNEYRPELAGFLAPFLLQSDSELDQVRTAIEMYRFQKRPADKLADLYLNASYLLRDGDQIQRRLFQHYSIVYYRLGLKSNAFEGDEYWVIHYLIGDLYRRIGYFGLSKRYFREVLNQPNLPEWLSTITTEQMELSSNKDSDNSI